MFVRRVWPTHRERGFAGQPASLLREFERWLDAATGPLRDEPESGVFPALNITRDAEKFYVRAELPGVDAGALDISSEGAKLTISGSREIQAEQGDVSYHRRERAAGSFSRTVVLPNEVDSEHVDALYADGILTITLPLAEAAKAKQIKVRTD